MGFGKRSHFHGKKRGDHCHRFNVNVTAKWMPEVILLNIARKGSRSHGEKRGNHCHRFNVNVTAKWMPEVILLNIT